MQDYNLQVSVCSGYDLFYPIVNIQTHIHSHTNTGILTSLYEKLGQLS